MGWGEGKNRFVVESSQPVQCKRGESPEGADCKHLPTLAHSQQGRLQTLRSSFSPLHIVPTDGFCPQAPRQLGGKKPQASFGSQRIPLNQSRRSFWLGVLAVGLVCYRDLALWAPPCARDSREGQRQYSGKRPCKHTPALVPAAPALPA